MPSSRRRLPAGFQLDPLIAGQIDHDPVAVHRQLGQQLAAEVDFAGVVTGRKVRSAARTGRPLVSSRRTRNPCTPVVAGACGSSGLLSGWNGSTAGPIGSQCVASTLRASMWNSQPEFVPERGRPVRATTDCGAIRSAAAAAGFATSTPMPSVKRRQVSPRRASRVSIARGELRRCQARPPVRIAVRPPGRSISMNSEASIRLASVGWRAPPTLRESRPPSPTRQTGPHSTNSRDRPAAARPDRARFRFGQSGSPSPNLRPLDEAGQPPPCGVEQTAAAGDLAHGRRAAGDRDRLGLHLRIDGQFVRIARDFARLGRRFAGRPQGDLLADAIAAVVIIPQHLDAAGCRVDRDLEMLVGQHVVGRQGGLAPRPGRLGLTPVDQGKPHRRHFHQPLLGFGRLKWRCGIGRGRCRRSRWRAVRLASAG